jgi:cell division protein FtsB
MANQTQAPPTPKERAERSESRLKIATAVLTLLTALFALIAGVFVKKTDTASGHLDDTQEQVRILASKNAALAADNAQKDAKIKQLEADPSASDPQPDGEPSANGTPAVFHKGPLTLKLDVHASMDARPEQTQWNIDGSDWDILFQSNGGVNHLAVYTGAKAMLSKTAPSFSTCHDNTGYSNEDIPLVSLSKYKTLCVITREGRYSALGIKSSSDLQASFDVTTYAKEGD